MFQRWNLYAQEETGKEKALLICLVFDTFCKAYATYSVKGQRGENLKGKSILLIAVSIGILMSLNLVLLANAQPYRMAYFENIKVIHTYPDGRTENFELVNDGTAKVYDNDNLLLYLIFYNENLMPSANLYTKIYIDNELQRTSDNLLTPGGRLAPGTYGWPTISSGPDNQRWKVELWWENNLEDAKEFNVWVVKLYVENWSPAPITVEKGTTAPSSWSITFNNGGNDVMENVSISVADPVDLQITPTSQNLDNVIAGGSGSTSFSVTALPLALTTGQRDVKFQITYYDFMGISHTETISAPVIVDRLSTSIALSLDPSSVGKDNSTAITAMLVDGNGSPVTNQEISFSVGTTSIGSENTDSSGKATQIFLANVDAGTFAINASFAGTVDYKPSSQTTNLTVEPFKTTLVLDIVPSSTVPGDTVTLKATLKDEKSIPLPNENVEFQINGTTIDSATTDSNGVASIQYKTSIAGTLDVKAVFAGETNYENSYAIDELVVEESIALKLGITVAAVVIAAAVAVLILARRRGMKIPPMERKEEGSPPPVTP